MQKRLTNKRRTRQRLSQAILTTLHRHGIGSLTTARVASQAGIAQPTFYVHFRNMDEALEELATSVVGRFETALAPDPSLSDEHPAVVLHDAVARCTRVLIADKAVAEVFLRFRRDRSSALGRAWTLVVLRIHELMRELVCRIRPSITAPLATLHAEMLVGIILGLGEGSVDGRITDLDEATLIASRAVVASLLSEHATAAAAPRIERDWGRPHLAS